MAHDVFISYSNKDKPIADGICVNLESAGIRCWIAPRDIAPGEDWPTAIARAISQSRIMVLVFSASSNSSEDVGRELILAANNKLVIIPFKIENIEPEPGKQYYLARTHWLDAINPPTQEQILKLIDYVKAFLSTGGTPSVDGRSVQTSDPLKPISTPKKKSAWLRYLWIPIVLVLFGFLAWIMIIVGLNQHITKLAQTPTTINDQVLPTSQSQYIFQDDFSDETSGWNISANKVAEKYYKSGEYFMHILPGYASDYSNAWSIAGIENLTDVAIDVDARFIGGEGAYGVIVNYLGEDSFYFFEIAPNGYWDLVQRTGGESYDLVKFIFTPAIRSGNSVNHLRIELSSSPMLYVNGQLISSLNIPYGKGGIGLWATAWHGNEFEVAFDNFVVTTLP
jgi:hypothetical protein